MSQLPQPLSATGQVTFDPVTRSLLVKPAERGWAGLIWDRGHAALMQDDGSSLAGPRPVFARVAGRGEIGRGEAVRDGWLRFQLSDADYRALARPDTSAIFTVDKQLGTILAVRFIG